MNKISIIKASENMCAELAKIKRQVWETTYRGIYPDEKLDNYNFTDNESKFKSYIKSPIIDLYVAMIDNKIVGYTAVGKSDKRKTCQESEVVLLYILKQFQGMGIGKKLFDFAKNKLKKEGHKQFVVYCNKYNVNAQSFYKKMGGKVIHVDDDNENHSLPQIKFLYNSESV